MVRECRHLGTGKSSFPSSRRWPGSGARLLAIRRSDGVAKTAGPRARSSPAGGRPVHTAPQPGRRQHPYRSGTGGRGRIGEGVPARFYTWPHCISPLGQAKALPAEDSPPPKERKAPLPRSLAKSYSAEERPAPREPAGGQPSGNQRFQKGRRGRPAVGVGTGQRQSLSSPLVVSQSAGCSYRHRSRRVPRPLEKSAHTRLAAGGKLGPLTPAVEIRE